MWLQWSWGHLPGCSSSVGAFVPLSAPSGLSEPTAHGAGNPSAWSVGAKMGSAEQREMENGVNERYGKYSGVYQGAPS